MRNVSSALFFAIDGVIDSFVEIHEKQYDSVWDCSLFHKLRELHERFNIMVTLYVYEKKDEFSIQKLSDKYWEEFRGVTWINFGWHQQIYEKVSEEDEDAVQSFYRITEFIKEKMGQEHMTKAIAPYQYRTTQLLREAFQKKGIRMVFDTEEDRNSSMLPEEFYQLLKKRRTVTGDIIWRKRDICFDKVDSTKAVEEKICETKDLLDHFVLANLYTFVHERSFGNCFRYIEEYFVKFFEERLNERCKIPLYPFAGKIVDEIFYFATGNDKNVYSLELSTMKMRLLARLGLSDLQKIHFETMAYYDNNLFLVPGAETSVWSINLLTKEVREYPLPWTFDPKDHEPKYRSGVQQGEKIWFLKIREPVLVEFNMRTGESRGHKNWPLELDFTNRKYPLLSMFLQEDWLYFFSGDCNMGVKVDTRTGEMQPWEEGKGFYRGAMYDGKIYTAPFMEQKEFWIVDLDEGTRVHKTLEWEIPENGYNYSLPYIDGNDVYFTSLVGNEFLIYHCCEDTFSRKEIEMPKGNNLGGMFRTYCGRYIMPYQDKLLLMPHFNNVLVIYDPSSDEQYCIYLTRPCDEVYRDRIQEELEGGKIIGESKLFGIKELLNIGFDRKENQDDVVSGADIYGQFM